jgi:hypothetical protein
MLISFSCDGHEPALIYAVCRCAAREGLVSSQAGLVADHNVRVDATDHTHDPRHVAGHHAGELAWMDDPAVVIDDDDMRLQSSVRSLKGLKSLA